MLHDEANNAPRGPFNPSSSTDCGTHARSIRDVRGSPYSATNGPNCALIPGSPSIAWADKGGRLATTASRIFCITVARDRRARLLTRPRINGLAARHHSRRPRAAFLARSASKQFFMPDANDLDLEEWQAVVGLIREKISTE